MSIVYLLLPIGLLMSALALGWFIWSVRQGQYDDLDTPPLRAILDDETEKPEAAPRT